MENNPPQFTPDYATPAPRRPVSWLWIGLGCGLAAFLAVLLVVGAGFYALVRVARPMPAPIVVPMPPTPPPTVPTTSPAVPES